MNGTVSKYLEKYFAGRVDELEKFDVIADMLMRENEKFNLTALRDAKDIAFLHFYDSLTVLGGEVERGKRLKMIDIGSGAGFPSLPLAVAVNTSSVTMLDSTAKKLAFAMSAANAAGLKNVGSVCGRAEEYAHDKLFRESYDIALARGVAPLNILLEWCLPFVRPGGFFVAMKGRAATQELTACENALAVLGGTVRSVREAEIPETEHVHTLITIEKTAPTPDIYPRQNSVTKKKPL